jgi:putative FmdB family regulatory protein
MPIYEFKCNECGEAFSEIRRMGDDKGVPCPKCRSSHTKKLISNFASISAGEPSGCPSVSQCSHAGTG